MYTIKKVNKNEISQMREDYYKNLIAPMDDFWETGVFPHCEFFSITEENVIGFFSLDGENILNQLYVMDQSKYKEILQYIITVKKITKAYASSYDPLFLEACKLFRIDISDNTLLYTEGIHHKPTNPIKCITYKVANSEDLEQAIDYSNNAGIGGDWIIDYYKKIMKFGGLILFIKNNKIIGTGESRPSEKSKNYANIGVSVGVDYRRKGIATYIINTMREMANSKGEKAICSTTTDNIASQLTLSKCGFTIYHKIYNISFK